MSFPQTRMRRLRRTPALRRMVRETALSRSDLILPLFAVEGSGVREPVVSMPGVSSSARENGPCGMETSSPGTRGLSRSDSSPGKSVCAQPVPVSGPRAIRQWRAAVEDPAAAFLDLG